jgi:hypothetical protein
MPFVETLAREFMEGLHACLTREQMQAGGPLRRAVGSDLETVQGQDFRIAC